MVRNAKKMQYVNMASVNVNMVTMEMEMSDVKVSLLWFIIPVDKERIQI